MHDTSAVPQGVYTARKFLWDYSLQQLLHKDQVLSVSVVVYMTPQWLTPHLKRSRGQMWAPWSHSHIAPQRLTPHLRFAGHVVRSGHHEATHTSHPEYTNIDPASPGCEWRFAGCAAASCLLSCSATWRTCRHLSTKSMCFVLFFCSATFYLCFHLTQSVTFSEEIKNINTWSVTVCRALYSCLWVSSQPLFPVDLSRALPTSAM